MKRVLILLLLIVSMMQASVSAGDADFETNAGVGISKDLSTGSSVFIDGQYKYEGPFESNYFRRFEAGGDLDISERISLRGSLKNINILESDGWDSRFVPGIAATIKWKPSRLEVDLRNTLELWNIIKEGDFQFRFKQKLKIAAPLKIGDIRIKPYVSDEYLASVNSNDHLIRNRFSAGNTFYVGKVVSIDTFYMWQSKNAIPEWEDTHILGTKLSLSF